MVHSPVTSDLPALARSGCHSRKRTQLPQEEVVGDGEAYHLPAQVVPRGVRAVEELHGDGVIRAQMDRPRDKDPREIGAGDAPGL